MRPFHGYCIVTNHIQKVVTKSNLRDRKSDFAFWQSQPYLLRLAAIKEIRQEYHRWD